MNKKRPTHPHLHYIQKGLVGQEIGTTSTHYYLMSESMTWGRGMNFPSSTPSTDPHADDSGHSNPQFTLSLSHTLCSNEIDTWHWDRNSSRSLGEKSMKMGFKVTYILTKCIRDLG